MVKVILEWLQNQNHMQKEVGGPSKVAALRDSGDGFYGDGKDTTTTTWTEGDTISVAFDADAAKVWIAKNGFYINGGNPASGYRPSFSGLTFKDYYFLVSDNKYFQIRQLMVIGIK